MKHEEKINRVYDLVKEIVDIMNTMSLKELQMFKLEYEIIFKQIELNKLKSEEVKEIC